MTMDGSTYGIRTNPNPNQKLTSIFNGKKYYRYPVSTPLIKIDDCLDEVIKKYGKPFYEKGDIFCIASKVVSICEGFYVKEEDLKISWLAKFLVRFVKKWPDDPGFAIPQKIQVAMNEAGLLRFLIAVVVGGMLKLIGFPGFFYRIAGNSINAIDGFAPEFYPLELQGYGFLAPQKPYKICDEIEAKTGMRTVMLDGNNVENIVMGISKGLKECFSKKDLLIILEGNPQGQDCGTPILIVKDHPWKEKAN